MIQRIKSFWKVKNTVQALKYPSAHAVTLYMPGFKAINWKKRTIYQIDKTKMAVAASQY